MQVPIDSSIKNIQYIPYTISFVIRKRIQISSLQELPKEKRPPELMIWDGTSDDIDEWLEKVYGTKKNKEEEYAKILIKESDIEG